ncbi:MAG: hypothetical protein AB8B91_07345 [Rubripirellula sp.]
MRQAIFTLLCAGVLSFGTSAVAQSTISDDTFEVSGGVGLWGAFLPDYELGENADGGVAFQDDLDDLGYITQLKAVRRFLGTRTSFEADVFYASADSVSNSEVIDVDVPNPQNGASNPGIGQAPRLNSEANHYGYNLTLRDTWRTRFGGLSAGCAFSYMRLDQNFDVDYGGTHWLNEDLDSKFRGGKGFVGWDGVFAGRQSNLDLLFGFYDMDVDYTFNGESIAGSLNQEFSKTIGTIETRFTTRTAIRSYLVGWTIGATYFTDLPTIEHNVLSPVSIGTDDAVTLTGMVEILL